MTEYITKEQALKVMKNFERQCKTPMECVLAVRAYNAILSIPAADVVEVVRCKDCKYFYPWVNTPELGDCMIYVCDLEGPCTVKETDFCSDGERRS